MSREDDEKRGGSDEGCEMRRGVIMIWYIGVI